jgi:hypothetical protein
MSAFFIFTFGEQGKGDSEANLFRISVQFIRKDTMTKFIRFIPKFRFSAKRKLPPQFDKRIFWDINYNNLDYEKKASFIIERVFERGDVPDIRSARRYYGDEKIKTVLTKARCLPLNAIYLASTLFGNELTDYRCYNIAQSNPEHWIF